MKKFLDLKKSIVDSKNQPTIVQTYLDTIRSSCYKLATPAIHTQSQTQSQNQSRSHPSLKIDNNSISRKLDSQSSSFKKVSAFPLLSQKKRPCKNDVASDQILMKTPQKQMKFFYENKEIAESQKIQQILSDLSSNCKQSFSKSNTNELTQKQIMETILVSLSKLQSRKQYKSSIELIRTIILSLGNIDIKGQDKGMIDIINHSQMKNFGYIVPKEGDSQHEDSQSWDEEKFKNTERSKTKNQQPKNDSPSLKNQRSLSKKSECNTIPIRQNRLSHGNSIYIQQNEDQQEIGFESQQTERHDYNNRSPINNSMQSDSSCKWPQQSLYCIQEQDEEQSSVASAIPTISQTQDIICKIPEQTIQFKKIIYMLDSSTNKKSGESLNSKVQRNMKEMTSKSLFINQIDASQDSLCKSKEKINRTYTQGMQNIQIEAKRQLQQTSLFDKISDESYFNNSKTLKVLTKNSKQAKLKQQTINLSYAKSSPVKKNQNSINKSKDLADIVDMLNNKYNRNVNVKLKNNSKRV